jgi:hypothetical protein
LVFLEVVDRTLAELGPSSASVASLGGRILTLESKLMPSDAGLLLESPTSGLKLQLQLQNGEPGLPAFLARQQSLAPLLDFTGLGGRSVEGSLQIAREAGYNSTVGFDQVLDVSGAVIDPLTGAILQPADHGYQQAALHHSNLLAPLADLSIENRGASSRELSIQADGIFAPYAVVDTGKDIHTFFAFQEANPDQLQHFQMLGDNTFVLEDLKDGVERDFDDLIVSFDPIRLAPFTAA